MNSRLLILMLISLFFAGCPGEAPPPPLPEDGTLCIDEAGAIGIVSSGKLILLNQKNADKMLQARTKGMSQVKLVELKDAGALVESDWHILKLSSQDDSSVLWDGKKLNLGNAGLKSVFEKWKTLSSKKGILVSLSADTPVAKLEEISKLATESNARVRIEIYSLEDEGSALPRRSTWKMDKEERKYYKEHLVIDCHPKAPFIRLESLLEYLETFGFYRASISFQQAHSIMVYFFVNPRAGEEIEEEIEKDLFGKK